MSGFEVPIPTLPAWVALTWTRTRSAVIVECARCRSFHALYTTYLRLRPTGLVEAVGEHEGCTTGGAP